MKMFVEHFITPALHSTTSTAAAAGLIKTDCLCKKSVYELRHEYCRLQFHYTFINK